MAKPEARDSQPDLSAAASEVRVTVFRLEAQRDAIPPRVRKIAAAALCVAIVGVVLVASRSGGPRSVIWGARQAGQAGVAAAYGYPPGCLHVMISATDPAFARADVERPGSCTDDIGFPSALFHRLGGEWHPVLYAVRYPCPLPSIPASIQRQLALCPR